MSAFGSQSMAATLRRVLMRSAANAMRDADRSAWHYGPGFNPAKAASQHAALAELVAASGAEIEWVEDKADGLSDSVFTHDPSLMTGRGALILSMGKPLRAREPSLHEETYTRLGIPILGRVEAPGQVEGGDCVWVDARTLAIGRGVRSNQEGIQQVSNLLTPLGVSVYGFDLPLWQGEEACLHLMSVISPLADDLALVYSPLLPAPFYQMLKARGIRLVEGDAEEFAASNGLSLNVLPTSPLNVIAVAGFPKTKAAMEAAGCMVEVFEADALCIACEGGPTCLTRPILRQ
ncbi:MULTISPECIES: dimethylarginine dimethylaminohydrolase family protein [unclassified Mesorhizobium]|uniref:dimethylarginine dimethylaminohydrolase family protein n=1 Tax=unclassified Mesorhizobium TaxID=325217 RepID=UPI0011260C28|nr:MULTISPECIES: dimethylarginine dimethylaminohydrolase family protein [unclassified Mesorhizobium]TPJ49236.1 amidinotransferase [Mesorhizobium sp. B2-6-6]MBZ9705053.1 dimethylarginine dimethylaminohydrolase family protein [Mesorhizobium sp. CO1-1-3]MBZ9947566.1 dimethylarginine dimethylaminohydrolase family protein [Mesorhizobium sp. BR1-1-11]MCA0000401.1 dimethylarginine dimethylaminohydrolase family protein [Mesorhizobium sp. B264B2A]MCA0010264.1 dimethylarginine dimethylaminohydrolase fam